MEHSLRKHLSSNKEERTMKVIKMFFMGLLMVVFMSGCGSGGGSGTGIGSGGGSGPVPDTTAPTVSSSIPADGATGVSLNGNITATFSEGMDPATITTSTFTLTQSGTPVVGAVTYVGTVATFDPTGNLTASTLYTGTITTGAKDLAGNALAVNKTWSFTTGAGSDTTAPTVSSTIPADLATGVSLNGSISTTFSEAMDPATITTTTFTLKQGGTSVLGVVTYVGTTATFKPTGNLAASTLYTATITTGATDLAGNALAVAKTWSFTTGAALDTTAPTVSSTNPADLATGVALNGNITATFSEGMDPATITTTTFTLKQGGTSVLGAVTYVGTVATFKPTGNLAAITTYVATITTGVQDLAGNALAVAKTWSFTTGSAAALGPAAVNLGTAGNFVILTKSGITNIPTSAITGNIGTSPITGAAITGLGCGEISGTIYTVDAAGPACRVISPSTLTTAVGDMQIAYTDAAGRVTPDFTNLGAGNITGLTLVPGLYKWTTGVNLQAGGVTISGAANDVWIFQISGTLIVDSGAIVTLVGGARAQNIFWQVTGQTTLGTTSQFKGIILDQTAIVIQNGAKLNNGRALAQTAVTLDANTVTQP